MVTASDEVGVCGGQSHGAPVVSVRQFGEDPQAKCFLQLMVGPSVLSLAAGLPVAHRPLVIQLMT